MVKYDKNHDGQITLDELKSFLLDNMKELKTIFDSIDINHDGTLTIDEVCILFGIWAIGVTYVCRR